jgi:hypothetical protein
MPKVFGKVGASLADVYDVKGSMAGVEQLDTDTVSAVHEMGNTIFSERISGQIFRKPFDAIGQNVTLGGSFSGLPEVPFRLLGFAMLVESGLVARLTRMTASLSSLDAAGTATQDIPFFAWDTTLGTSENVRVFDDGATSNFDMLIPAPGAIPQLPLLLTGSLQRGVVNGITMRGLSAGFGAGTVNIIGLAYILYADASGSGISSQGLPIPSW